jgi:hypothetical protein
MLSTAHFFSGVIIFTVLTIFSVVPKTFLFFGLIVICSMIPDADIAFTKLHRNLFSHTPLFWFIISLIVCVVASHFWFLVLPFLFHFFLDTIDYGVMVLYPFSRKKYGYAILGKTLRIEQQSQFAYLKEYLKNRNLLFLELIIMLSSIIFLIFITLA